MSYSILQSVRNASGLSEFERDTVYRLMSVWQQHQERNSIKVRYYEDRNQLKNLGMAVPKRFLESIATEVGWAAKAVDYLAMRSQFDGFTCIDEDVSAQIQSIMDANDMSELYSMAVPSELIHGCGFWTVTKGAQSEQDVIINYRDAQSAAALWDWRHKVIEAGLTIEDWAPVNDKVARYEPSCVNIYLRDYVITIERERKSTQWYVSSAIQHNLGRPLMEPMVHRKSWNKPFGRSRISKAVMAITDEMQRELVRTALHSECYSAPQKYMLGATDEAFDMDKFSLAYNSFMLVGKDEDGELPTLGQFSQASMEPHIKAQELLMSKMAAETSVPVAAFGLSSNGYTSSDALRASTDDLILLAQNLNAANGRTLRRVAMLALALQNGRKLNELTDEEKTITVHWIDPSMPTISARSDSMMKQATVCEWFPETDVYWEGLGYDEGQRTRIKADKVQAERKKTLLEAMQPSE